MLWTVVICDLVFKVKELKDLYQDKTAQAIFDEISKMQKDNPKDPSWENRLLSLMSEKLSLYSEIEKTELESIQKRRHLSAHPILDQNDILYHPNRESVLADIRYAIELVLSKPSVLSKNIFSDLLEDLSSIKDTIKNDGALRRYLTSRYFGRLPDVTCIAIFKSLWRVTFCVEDERAKENRNINYKALRILYEINPTILNENIKSNSPYYSDRLLPLSKCQYYVYLMGDYPALYNFLTEAAKVKLNEELNKDLSADFVAYFKSENVSSHIEYLDGIIQKKISDCEDINVPTLHIKDLFRHAQSAGCAEKLIDLCIDCHIKSYSYDMADSTYNNYISPVLNKMSIEKVKNLLEGANKNHQIHDRRKSVSSNNEMFSRAEELDSSFDRSEYSNLS